MVSEQIKLGISMQWPTTQKDKLLSIEYGTISHFWVYI